MGIQMRSPDRHRRLKPQQQLREASQTARGCSVRHQLRLASAGAAAAVPQGLCAGVAREFIPGHRCRDSAGWRAHAGEGVREGGLRAVVAANSFAGRCWGSASEAGR
jgi:hypothetical protein